jgi:hypothetical protein
MYSTLEPTVRQVTVPQVILILGLSAIMMTGVIILSLNGQDVAAVFGTLTTLGVLAAGALGVNVSKKLDQVKEISNGRLTEILEKNQKLQDQVTAMAMLLQPPQDPSK